MAIPRIIHQVWFKVGKGPATPPKEYDAMRQSWRDYHPDWTFYDWDLPASRQFLADYYPEYLPLFDSYKKTIYQIDAIRYFLLHHYGGFYVDTDATCVRSLEPLRKHRVILATNKYISTGLIIHNNHFMAAVPRSAFFESCYQKLPAARPLNSKQHSYVSVMTVAGPFFLTSVAGMYKKKNDIYILRLTEEQLYLTHHEKHSWKMTRSILWDVGRVAAAGAALTIGGAALWKHYTKNN